MHAVNFCAKFFGKQDYLQKKFLLGWVGPIEVVNSVHFTIFSLKTRIDKLETH